MKTLIRLLTLTSLLILQGCVPSLQPFYADKDVIFEPSLVGTRTDSKETWEFKKDSERSYKIAYTDEEGKQGEFIVQLFRVEGKSFMDFVPGDARGSSQRFLQEPPASVAYRPVGSTN